jgi:hypothetical protein
VRVKQANIFGLVFLGKVEIALPMTQEKKGEKEIKRYYVQGCKNNFTLYGIIL